MSTRTWSVDPSHSTVGFSVRHLMISKVRGRFSSFTASLTESGGAFSGVTADIDAASIDTREEKRDAHLRSADFFDAEKNPKLTFASTKVESRGGDKYVVRGNLTMHGITKEVALDVELLGRAKDPWGNERVAFQGKASVDRTEFGLNWNQALEAGGILVGEKVDIEIEAQFIAPKA
ncbi:MAG: YceI family protein [Polyangiaceae bacterium]